ncbi:hypothetical protein E6C67_03730 (plasmid) [Azospirillum sp. TSA2s]|uniref:hypothetical protein n=1 Tax=Azospirillum sp. TSA2s TaxID=709810 RepID=UPI0010AAE1B3|nr:hypothetical protein [Azospirillum sp. TSA2s]QCG93066.1 hypothetical protein E6C67_03730 [Azospirillum sp. TSA2s]
MPSLLITSAGSLVADAILRCLEEVRPAWTIVGVNSAAAAIAFGCDRLYRVPPSAEAEAYAAALRHLLAQLRPAIVLPGRDEDVPALAALAASGDFAHTRFPVPPPSLAPVFTDKLETARFARTHRLPFAATAQGPADALALARRCGYPLLAKPRRGAGSQSVSLLWDAAAVEQAAGDPRLMVQAFLGADALEGQWEAYRRTAAGMPWRWGFTDVETTAELLIADDGTVSALCTDCGITAPPLRTDIRLTGDHAVAAVGLAWAHALAAHGHRGVVNIQGKRLPDGGFVPYEIAARFGGTTVARALLGCNLVLSLVTGKSPDRRPDTSRRATMVGLEPQRLAVPDAWHRSFEETGVWTKPAGLAPLRRLSGGGSGRATADSGCVGGPDDGGWDRGAVAAYAASRGLPFVPTATTLAAAAALVQSCGFPVILKPRHRHAAVRLAEDWETVAAAFAAKPMPIVQPCLGGDTLAAQRSAWAERAGAPWNWTVIDHSEIAEADIRPDGGVWEPRSAICRQRGGDVVEIRPTCDPRMIATLRLWSTALAGDGHRGPVRLTGKRGLDGAWLPFSVQPDRLGVPPPGLVTACLVVPAFPSTRRGRSWSPP